MLAQSKGRSLGLYEEREKSEAEQRKREKRDRELGVQKVDCFGMHIPAAPVGGALLSDRMRMAGSARPGGRFSE